MHQDDDGRPLCHFEVDEHGEIHQRVDPALAAYPNQWPDDAQVYLGIDGDNIAYLTRRDGAVTYHRDPHDGRVHEVPDPEDGIPGLDSWIMKLYEEYQATRDSFAELAKQSRVDWQTALDEWIEVADQAKATPMKLTEWQRQLLLDAYSTPGPLFYSQRQPVTSYWLRAHIDRARTGVWENQLDAVRADHDEQQHRRLWSERDLTPR